MTFRVLTAAYFVAVGFCVSYIIWSFATEQGDPYPPTQTYIALLVLAALTLPWSSFIIPGIFLLSIILIGIDVTLIGDLHISTTIGLALCIAAAALNIFLVKRHRARKLMRIAQEAE
jgi:hypothetical protein